MLVLLGPTWVAGAVGQDVSTILDRALRAFYAGRIDESVADFDLVAQRAPGQAPHLWQRGIALYYAGRHQDCREQFESHRIVNPNDVENAAWHFLCVAKLESPEAARSALLPVGPDRREPMARIYEMLRGEVAPEELFAGVGAAPMARFYAHLYQGLYYEAAGQTDDARASLQRAAASEGIAGGAMHTVAVFHLAWLDRRRPSR